MPSTTGWLATVVRVAIVPVFVGALVLLSEPGRSATDLAAAAGLVLLGAIHAVYWWRPLFWRARWAVVAIVSMALINFVLLDLLSVLQPLLWLYPALIAGAGLRAPFAVAGVGLTALAAGAPMALEGGLV